MQIIQGLEKKNSALSFFKNHTNQPTKQTKNPLLDIFTHDEWILVVFMLHSSLLPPSF